MTFFLTETESDPLLQPLRRQVGIGKTLVAGSAAQRVEDDQWDRQQRTSWNLLAEQKRKLEAANVYGEGPGRSFHFLNAEKQTFEKNLDYVLERNKELTRDNPELRNFGLPTTREEFAGIVTDRLNAEYSDAIDVLKASDHWGAELTGRMWAGTTDKASVMSMFLGAPAGARVLTAALIEGGINTGVEATILPRQFEMAERLGLPEPNVAEQLGMAALTGGLVGGGIAGALRYSEYRRTRNAALAGQRPPDAPQLGFGDDVARAGRQMPEEAMPPEPSSTGTMDGTFGPAPGADGAAAELPAFDRVIEAGRGFTVVQSADGTAQRREGARNWRNHNPGNIEYGDFARRHGAIGTDGRFAVFPTYEAGRAAKAALLFESGPYRDLSIADAINRYAPPFENDTGAYVSVVARAVGVSPDTPTASLTPAQRQVMLDAMERHEGFKPGKVNGVQASARQRDGASADAGTSSFSGYSTRRGFTATGQVSAGDGFRIDVEYQVVELASLQRASGDLQPRDRSRASSDEQISAIAAGLDPARLMPSPEADRGAPIVGPDSMVESGNGRVAAIDRAYTLHPDRAEAYRQQIIAAGFEIPEGMKRPVLIGRRTSELDGTQRQGFVRAANTSQIARMSATERAATDARGISSAMLSLFRGGKLAARANDDFTRAFLDTMPQAERSGLVGKNKIINAEGIRRIEEALFARAWTDPDVVARYAETDPGELKTLLDALASAGPDWAALRAAVAEGRIRPEMDITPFVLDAMRTIALARDLAAREGGKLETKLTEIMAQDDFLAGSFAPLTRALIGKFTPNGRAAAADTIAEFLKRYAAEAQKIGGPDATLFDAPGPLDVLKAIDKAAFGDLTEIGRAAVPPAPEPEIRLVELPEGAFPDGAASPEVEAADAAVAQQLRDAADMTPPRTLQEVEKSQQALADLKASQPFDTVDELYELAPAAQSFLEHLGARVADDLGITFKTPGLKVKATAAEKMQRKAYETAREMTDVARGGFLVNTAEDADRLVDQLAAVAGVLDEGWTMSAAGYLDRKVLVQTPNGVVAEVQIWSPAMLQAKDATGHALYERYRISDSAEESEALKQQMHDLYSEALSRDDASFAKLVGTSKSPKPLANQDFSVSAESSTRAVWNTSAASTGTQSPPGLRSASASFREAENSTAGRPSQSVNTGDVMGDTSGSNVDAADLDDKALQELQAFAAEEFELEKDIRLSVREMLDSIDQDDALATVVDLCGLKGKA